MRCDMDRGIPHCNLCWDRNNAPRQIQEGTRNRDFSRRQLPLVVPDHYPDVRVALEKSFWFTFFDDEADRGWIRRCRFWYVLRLLLLMCSLLVRWYASWR